MNGPQHYAEAERLLKKGTEGGRFLEKHIAAAHVHATLALTAATVTHAPLQGWEEVLKP